MSQRKKGNKDRKRCCNTFLMFIKCQLLIQSCTGLQCQDVAPAFNTLQIWHLDTMMKDAFQTPRFNLGGYIIYWLYSWSVGYILYLYQLNMSPVQYNLSRAGFTNFVTGLYHL